MHWQHSLSQTVAFTPPQYPGVGLTGRNEKRYNGGAKFKVITAKSASEETVIIFIKHDGKMKAQIVELDTLYIQSSSDCLVATNWQPL